jgi:uncharacterized protein (TIGR02246 family)
MKADTKTENAVMNTIKKCFEAFGRRDLDAMLAFFAPDPDVVVIGTGKDEKGIGFTQIKAIFERAFAQFNEASFEFGWHSVSVAGPLAWLATDVSYHVKAGDRESNRQIRLTGIMEKREDRWLILQSHDSAPDRDQAEGQAFSWN